MDNVLNIGDFNIISTLNIKDYNYLLGKLSVILEKENLYFFVEDEKEKIEDILKMPVYIKNDWIIYNKKDLTLSIINQHIKYYNSILDESDNDILMNLMTIRRDFILDKIINKKTT
jgi:hypothetical protein